MPDPITMGTAAAAAFQNPQIQNAMLGVGRGLGRGLNYGLQGAGGMAQQVGTGIADILGGLGEQYLPENVNWAGGKIRDLNRYLSQGAGGLYNAIAGNQPQGQMGQQGMPGQMGAQQGIQGQMTPQEMMQQRYQQEIQQPYQFDYANQRQQLINQYNQQLLPQLARQFGGADAINSGAFRRSATGALGNLQTNLGALQERGRMGEAQLNQARLGQIGGYLGGQQQLGLGQRQLRQQGNIAQQQEALRQMGLMGGFGQQQQQNYMDQLLQQLNAQGNLANIGMNQPYQQIQQGQQPSWMWQMGPAMLQAGARVGGAAMGVPGLG